MMARLRTSMIGWGRWSIGHVSRLAFVNTVVLVLVLLGAILGTALTARYLTNVSINDNRNNFAGLDRRNVEQYREKRIARKSLHNGYQDTDKTVVAITVPPSDPILLIQQPITEIIISKSSDPSSMNEPYRQEKVATAQEEPEITHNNKLAGGLENNKEPIAMEPSACIIDEVQKGSEAIELTQASMADPIPEMDLLVPEPDSDHSISECDLLMPESDNFIPECDLLVPVSYSDTDDASPYHLLVEADSNYDVEWVNVMAQLSALTVQAKMFLVVINSKETFVELLTDFPGREKAYIEEYHNVKEACNQFSDYLSNQALQQLASIWQDIRVELDSTIWFRYFNAENISEFNFDCLEHSAGKPQVLFDDDIEFNQEEKEILLMIDNWTMYFLSKLNPIKRIAYSLGAVVNEFAASTDEMLYGHIRDVSYEHFYRVQNYVLTKDPKSEYFRQLSRRIDAFPINELDKRNIRARLSQTEMKHSNHIGNFRVRHALIELFYGTSDPAVRLDEEIFEALHQGGSGLDQDTYLLNKANLIGSKLIVELLNVCKDKSRTLRRLQSIGEWNAAARKWKQIERYADESQRTQVQCRMDVLFMHDLTSTWDQFFEQKDLQKYAEFVAAASWKISTASIDMIQAEDIDSGKLILSQYQKLISPYRESGMTFCEYTADQIIREVFREKCKLKDGTREEIAELRPLFLRTANWESLLLDETAVYHTNIVRYFRQISRS